MATMIWEVVDGKARYNGRTLHDWAPQPAANIAAVLKPVRAILFGSVARGDEGPDSDLDLLVVLDEVAPADRHHVTVMTRLAADVPVPMDVVVTDSRELFERRNALGLMQAALREGRILYEWP